MWANPIVDRHFMAYYAVLICRAYVLRSETTSGMPMATTSSESYPSDNRSLGEFGEQFKRKWQKRAKRRANRTRDVEHFERQERARAKMRFYELSSLAAIYAKERCSGNIENAYEELIKALDDVGFWGPESCTSTLM